MPAHSILRVGSTALFVLLTGCAASPYDFPVPTMIGQEQGFSMTGFIKGSDEAAVRARLEKRMRCANGVDFVSLQTQRADATIGTKIMHYNAVMKCRAVPG